MRVTFPTGNSQKTAGEIKSKRIVLRVRLIVENLNIFLKNTAESFTKTGIEKLLSAPASKQSTPL